MRKYFKVSFVLIVLLILSFTATCFASQNMEGSQTEKTQVQAKILVPEMIKIPKGSFDMGQVLPSGLRLGFPVHKVTFTRDFEMGKYEVTNAEYCAVLNYALEKDYLSGDFKNNVSVKNKEGSSEELLDLNGAYKGFKCEIKYADGKFMVEEGKEKRPVIYVSWCGAVFYCNILSEMDGLTKLYNLSDWSCNTYGEKGYRLPTEAEWEYVARYNDGRMLPWGNIYDLSFANFNLSVGHTTDVGSYEKGKSALGLYDLCGNVEEWVDDWYVTYSQEALIDPVIADGVYKEKRGGSWYRDDNNFAFSAYRYDTNYIYTSFFDIGFRIVETDK